MKYAEYPDRRTYVVVHCTGFGVQEAPYEEHEVVSSFYSLKMAQDEANYLKAKNNTPEEIASSWVPNTYHINVNTLTDEGKRLLDAFHIKFDELLDKAKTEGVRPVKIGDTTVYMRPCKEFDDPPSKKPKSPFGESRIIWSEPKKAK